MILEMATKQFIGDEITSMLGLGAEDGTVLVFKPTDRTLDEWDIADVAVRDRFGPPLIYRFDVLWQPALGLWQCIEEPEVVTIGTVIPADDPFLQEP